MKLVLLVVSVIAVFTADSQDIPVKPDHDLHSTEEGDLPSPDDPSFTGVLPPFPGFNFTGVHPPFPEEGEGPHVETIRATSCTDKYVSCSEWESVGYCSTTYAQWMSTNCPHTCNTCATSCTDKYVSCSEWASVGYCSTTYAQWMSTNCPHTCNTCASK